MNVACLMKSFLWHFPQFVMLCSQSHSSSLSHSHSLSPSLHFALIRLSFITNFSFQFLSIAEDDEETFLVACSKVFGTKKTQVKCRSAINFVHLFAALVVSACSSSNSSNNNSNWLQQHEQHLALMKPFSCHLLWST